MKPTWTPTLAWLVAVAIAVLLAFAGPESTLPNFGNGLPGTPAR